MWAGESYPLGATYDGAATNFSLYSERAERVELCLIAKDGSEDRVNLDEVDGFVWTATYRPSPRASGTASGVYGPWDPAVIVGPVDDDGRTAAPQHQGAGMPRTSTSGTLSVRSEHRAGLAAMSEN